MRLPLLSVFKDADLLSFFHERLKVYLRDMGARHDIIDAVLTPEADDLLLVARRAEALTAFITSEDGKNLLAGTKRARKCWQRKEKKGTVVADAVSPDLLKLNAEQALYAAIRQRHARQRLRFRRKIFAPPWKRCRSCAVRWIPSSKRFSSMMNDAAIRANRLALLKAIREANRHGRGFLQDQRLIFPRPALIGGVYCLCLPHV